jgi:hypothetical protein
MDPTAEGDPERVGHGIVGMRERVAAWGGEISFGPVPPHGWRVRASLPRDPTAGRHGGASAASAAAAPGVTPAAVPPGMAPEAVAS